MSWRESQSLDSAVLRPREVLGATTARFVSCLPHFSDSSSSSGSSGAPHAPQAGACGSSIVVDGVADAAEVVEATCGSGVRAGATADVPIGNFLARWRFPCRRRGDGKNCLLSEADGACDTQCVATQQPRGRRRRDPAREEDASDVAASSGGSRVASPHRVDLARVHEDVLAIAMHLPSGPIEERLLNSPARRLVTVSHDGELALWHEAAAPTDDKSEPASVGTEETAATRPVHGVSGDARPVTTGWLRRDAFFSMEPALTTLDGLSASGGRPTLADSSLFSDSPSSIASSPSLSGASSSGLGRGEGHKWKMMHAALGEDGRRMAVCSWLPAATRGALLLFKLDEDRISLTDTFRADKLGRDAAQLAASFEPCNLGDLAAAQGEWWIRFVEYSAHGGRLLVTFEWSTQYLGQKHVVILIGCVEGSTGNVLSARLWPGNHEEGVNANRRELLASQLAVLDTGTGRGLLMLSRGREVAAFDTDTLELVWCVQAPGSGVLRCFRYLSAPYCALLCPSENGTITVVWPAIATSQNRSSMQSVANGLAHKEITGIPTGMTYFIDVDTGPDAQQQSAAIWVSSESAVGRLFVESGTLMMEPESSSAAQQGKAVVAGQDADFASFHSVTCCGVDALRCSGNTHNPHVVSGDFTGNVMEWRIGGGGAPLARMNIGDPVRCIAANPENSLVAIGGLTGTVFLWDTHASLPPQKLGQVKSTVTVLKWGPAATKPSHRSRVDSVGRLAVGTTDGRMECWVVREKPLAAGVAGFDIEIEWEFLAHPPEANPREGFGSLTQFAEVWSCAWSPNGRFLATVSEDQTARIWAVAPPAGHGEGLPPTLVGTLRGHTLAATCVDWQFLRDGSSGDGRCVLVTCSDDKTLRVYETDIMSTGQTPKVELQAVLHTDDTEEWHTLTYCALERDGNRVVAATQHGYVGVWDVFSHEMLYHRKMHTGSIEGLAWLKYPPTAQDGEPRGLRVSQLQEEVGANAGDTLIVTCASDCTVAVHALVQANL